MVSTNQSTYSLVHKKMRGPLVRLVAFVTLGCATGNPRREAETRREPQPTTDAASHNQQPQHALELDAGPGTSELIMTVSGGVTRASTTALVNTPVLHSGDRLHLVVRTTQPAEAYVAYCDSANKLTVYPPQGSIALRPGVAQRIPETRDLAVDDNIGTETIFVIASKHSLNTKDPSLFEALLAAKTSAQPCTPALTMTTEESRASREAETQADPTKHPLRREDANPGVTAKVQPHVTKSTTQGPPQGTTGPSRTLRLPSVPGIYRPRGIFVDGPQEAEASVQSDANGIAILALTFRHEP